MNKRHLLAMSAAAVILCGTAGAQPSPDEMRQLLQQRIAEVKESIAQNQAQLHQYTWVETTEISLKGEVKKREQKNCRYGPDGKVQKTPVGGGEAQPASGGGRGRRQRGLKGKIVEKKVAELTDYMDRFASLIHRYVPPEPERMKAAYDAGNAAVNREAGSLVFKNYVKTGDQLTLSFDPAARKLRNYDVRSYLDGPDDAATLSVRFDSLHDGTNFVADALLEAKAKEIQIKISNFGHRLVGQ